MAPLNIDKVRIDIGNVGTGPDYFAYQFVNEWGEKLCREIEELRLKVLTLERENGELEMQLNIALNFNGEDPLNHKLQ